MKSGKKVKEQKKKIQVKVMEGPTSLGDGSFVDKTELYGLGDIAATSFYVVDFDNDGFDDLVTLPHFFSTPHFYRFNSLTAKFEELPTSPFKNIFRVSYLAFADFNGDHIQDVLVGVFNQKTSMNKEPLKLFLGSLNQGTYQLKHKPGAFPKSSIAPNSAIALLDYNLDGFLDVYVAHWFDVTKRRPEVVPDSLFKGSGTSFKDISFVLKDELLYAKGSGYYMAKPTIGVTSCDVNLDGYPDILTSSTAGYTNKLWKNVLFPTGGRAYKNIGDTSLYAQDKEGALAVKQGGNSLFSMCLDYNNDGLIDIVSGELTHSYDPEYRDRSTVLTGANFSPLKFLRDEYYMDDGTANWNQADKRGVSFDFDSDGLIDFSVDNSGFPPKSRLILFKQQKDHGYMDIAKRLGVDVLNPSGTVTCDFNRDGRPDILTGHSNIRRVGISKRVFLFENQITNNFKRVRIFVGSTKNKNSKSVGATIRLKTSKSMQTRFLNYFVGGQSSQNMDGSLWGLGSAETVDEVIVFWPFSDKNKKPIKKSYLGNMFKFTGDYAEFTICFEKGVLPGRQLCN